MKKAIALALFGLSATGAVADSPVVVVNEDNDRYFCTRGEEGMTVPALEAYVDRIAGGKVTHFFMCPSGQRTSYDSKAWEPIWTALDEPGGANSRWAKNAKTLHDRGIDPYQVWIRRCRARGISPWLSPRMNDAHNANMEWPVRNTTFWRTRKDLRNPGGTLNFGHQEVQDYTFALVKEQLDRYDIDGYELDFMRFDQHFPVDDATNCTHHLDRFVKRVQDYVKAKSAERGRRILLGVRAPTTPRAALSRGMDVGKWAQEGWVDWVCASSPWRTPDYNTPVDEWRTWFGPAAGRVKFLMGTDHGVTAFKWERTDMTPGFYAGFADVAWSGGADGIYLFNASYLESALATVCRKGLFPEDLPSYRRRYPVSFRDTAYGVVPDDLQLPRLSDRVNRFRVRLGAKPAGRVTVLVGVRQDGPFNPPITLNGFGPIRSRAEKLDVVCRDHPDRSVPYFCRRFSFPSEAVHPGPDNVIELQPSETKMSIGWVEITLEEVKPSGEVRPVSALDELLPRPRTVVASAGTVAADCVADPEVGRKPVDGAPAAVADEAYSLEVSANGARIVAPTAKGERWARRTLAQLGKLSGGRVPCCRIVDWPALKWRGFMLDTARNFMDVKGLEELLDHMSAYKLNLFHWHLTENFAWRLESKRFPVLTEKGYYDPGHVRHRGKFYTQADFLHVVDYAAARGIVVMPELDVPGHAHAFRKAFGYATMHDPGVTETMTAILTELAELVPAEKMPFIHLGGDEVWDEHEKCSPGAFTVWAEAVSKTGHTVVSWDPGEAYEPKGPRVGMIWGEAQGGADATFPANWFDARGWYIEDFDPFELLPSAAYSRPFRGDAEDPRQIGAIFCAWHDASVGLPYARAWRNQPVWPACVLLGDLYWHGKPAAEFEPRYCRRLPLAGDPLLSRAADLERRTIAQRDRVLADDPHPFHFLRQTDQRWRLTDAKTGRLIARGIAQASITPFFSSGNPNNYLEASNGCVIAETWIRSPKGQTVGAWIGMTRMDRDHGRVRGGQGTPARGEWNRWGGTVELNGEKVAGPDWKLPNLRPGTKVPELPRNDMIDEIPFEDEEYYMREPTRIRLREGWNHVKLTMPMPKTVVTFWSQQWSGTFVPVLGTTDRPREVPGLVYSSDPPCDRAD